MCDTTMIEELATVDKQIVGVSEAPKTDAGGAWAKSTSGEYLMVWLVWIGEY